MDRRRFSSTLALALLLGFVAGSGVAAFETGAERNLQHGLYRIALELWGGKLLRALGVAVSSGGIALLLNASLIAAEGRIRGLAIPPAMRDGVCWLVATLPVAVWVGQSLHGFAPAHRPGVQIGYSVFAVLWVAVFFGLWRLRGSPTEQIALRLLHSLSAMSALAVVLVLVAGSLTARPPSRSRPNILLVVLDTVRADRLSSYGYHRATTIEIDDFGRSAILYPNFYATSSWTVPSHASLLTGLYSARHGATQEHLRLEGSFATLAEIMRNGGYQTWAASGNPYMGRLSNLSQGFETFVETWRYDPGPRTAAALHPANAAFSRFLEQRQSERPFFAFINYMDAHDPYATPEPFLSRYLADGIDPATAVALGGRGWADHYRDLEYTAAQLEVLSDLYDGSLNYLSAQVGRLIASVESEGLLENTLIVLTADHGEHFGENGLVGHYFGLYNTTVRIPLFIRLPGGERGGQVDSRKGQLVDLFPTLLRVAEIDTRSFDHRGIDLLASDDSPRRGSIFAEYYYPTQVLDLFTPDERLRNAASFEPFQRRLRSIERWGYRLIWSSDGRHELYRSSIDPGETHDLYPGDSRSSEVDALLDQLREELAQYAPEPAAADPKGWQQNLSTPTADAIDDETRDALRAIGYAR